LRLFLVRIGETDEAKMTENMKAVLVVLMAAIAAAFAYYLITHDTPPEKPRPVSGRTPADLRSADGGTNSISTIPDLRLIAV
jgi:hypothetical protein